MSLSLLVCVALCTAGSAHSESWETIVCAADSAEKAHNLKKAEELQIAALKQAETFGDGDPRLFMSLKGLADLYVKEEKPEEAQKLYLRYLAISDHLNYGHSDNPDRRDILLSLASISRSKGRMREAVEYYRRALPLSKQELGPNSEQVATINALIGYCCYFSKNYDEGITAVKETIRIRKIRQPHSLQLANDLAQLAGLYGDTHNYAQAEALGKQALEIRMRLCEPGDALIVRSIEGLAINKANQHKNDEAIALFNQGYPQAERAFGEGSYAMSGYMVELAGAYMDKGEYTKAIPLLEKALAIQKKVLSRENSTIARTTSRLADCYLRSGNSTGARHVCEGYLSFTANSKVSDEALLRVKEVLGKCHRNE